MCQGNTVQMPLSSIRQLTIEAEIPNNTRQGRSEHKQQASLVVVFDVMVGALIKCTRASAVTLTNHPPRTRMPNKALTNTVNYFDKYMYQLQL